MFVYGEPIEIPPDAGRDLMEERRLDLERALVSLTERAEAIAAGRVTAGPGTTPAIR